MSIPESTLASGILGVTRLASGKSLEVIAFMASLLRRRLPDVEIITGSITMFLAL